MRATSTRERDGILVGAGAGLTLIVLLVLQSFIGSGLLSTRTVTSTATVMALPTEDYSQVASAYTNHLFTLNSMNMSALLGEYESNATIEWRGQLTGLAGNYTGSNNISRLLGVFPGRMVNLTLTNQNQPIVVGVQLNYLVVSSTFDFYGFDSFDGNINGIITAQDSYTSVSNTWLIARETWTWISFFCEFPGCNAP
jgi:hypothetical protein